MRTVCLTALASKLLSQRHEERQKRLSVACYSSSTSNQASVDWFIEREREERSECPKSKQCDEGRPMVGSLGSGSCYVRTAFLVECACSAEACFIASVWISSTEVYRVDSIGDKLSFSAWPSMFWLANGRARIGQHRGQVA